MNSLYSEGSPIIITSYSYKNRKITGLNVATLSCVVECACDFTVFIWDHWKWEIWDLTMYIVWRQEALEDLILWRHSW